MVWLKFLFFPQLIWREVIVRVWSAEGRKRKIGGRVQCLTLKKSGKKHFLKLYPANHSSVVLAQPLSLQHFLWGLFHFKQKDWKHTHKKLIHKVKKKKQLWGIYMFWPPRLDIVRLCVNPLKRKRPLVCPPALVTLDQQILSARKIPKWNPSKLVLPFTATWPQLLFTGNS